MTRLAGFQPLHVVRTGMAIDAAFSFGRPEDHIPLGRRGFSGKMGRGMAFAAGDGGMGASQGIKLVVIKERGGFPALLVVAPRTI